MRVEMTGYVSGTRDGARWPAQGEVVDLPEAEAKALISAGMAKPAAAGPAPAEAAVPENAAEEQATVSTKPARKPRAPRKSD